MTKQGRMLRDVTILCLIVIILLFIIAIAQAFPVEVNYQPDGTSTITEAKILEGLQPLKLSQYDFIRVKPDADFQYCSVAMLFGIIILIIFARSDYAKI